MSTEPEKYDVVSVSLPRDFVRRADALIPKARRSQVVRELLAVFVDSVQRKKLEQAYAAYYAQRSAREVKAERDLLAQWTLTDDPRSSI